MATKIHKGLLVECPVCSGVQPERKFRRSKRTGITPEIAVRRQATSELGEEPTRFQKDAVFQKYGIHDPVIDRNVKKPSWKSEVVWQREMKQWHKDTEGMVPRQRFQESRRGYTPRTASNRTFTAGNPPRDARPSNLPNLPNCKVTPYPKVFRMNLKSGHPSTPSLPPKEFRNSPRGS